MPRLGLARGPLELGHDALPFGLLAPEGRLEFIALAFGRPTELLDLGRLDRELLDLFAQVDAFGRVRVVLRAIRGGALFQVSVDRSSSSNAHL